MSSLLVMIVINEFEFDGPENNAFIILKKLESREEIKQKAKEILSLCVGNAKTYVNHKTSDN